MLSNNQIVTGGISDVGGGDRTYAEDFLRDNIGKLVLLFLNFAGSQPPEKRTFEGKLVAIGRDYIVLETQELKNFLVAFMVNVAYFSFQEPVNIPKDIIPPVVAPPVVVPPVVAPPVVAPPVVAPPVVASPVVSTSAASPAVTEERIAPFYYPVHSGFPVPYQYPQNISGGYPYPFWG